MLWDSSGNIYQVCPDWERACASHMVHLDVAALEGRTLLFLTQLCLCLGQHNESLAEEAVAPWDFRHEEGPKI